MKQRLDRTFWEADPASYDAASVRTCTKGLGYLITLQRELEARRAPMVYFKLLPDQRFTVKFVDPKRLVNTRVRPFRMSKEKVAEIDAWVANWYSRRAKKGWRTRRARIKA